VGADRPWRGVAWARVLVVCGLLVGSGWLRSWQDRRIQQGLNEGRAAVVPLEKVPLEVGEWSGVDTAIDEQIARVTGADKIVTRRYTNRNTGVVIDVILLYGPAGNMFIHAPTLCYPTAGFDTVEGPEVKAVPVGAPATPAATAATATVPFLAAVYAKGEGTRAELQEVYWTWRYNGQWTPQVLKPKQIERVPSMIKVHTSRRVLRGERRDANNPNEALLRVLIPEIERLLPSRLSPTT
jgi:hypothetical protein